MNVTKKKRRPLISRRKGGPISVRTKGTRSGIKGEGHKFFKYGVKYEGE